MKEDKSKPNPLKNKNLKDYLEEHYPHLFNEGKLGFNELKAELGLNEYNEDILEKQFKFGLNWLGKEKAKTILEDNVENTLVYDNDKSLNGETSENILIEGDNLEALKLLNNGYYNSIKMIYIDPPYNTGKDFVYKDKFSTNSKEYLQKTNQLDEDGNRLSTNLKTDGRFHSNWLTMMYPRLRLARDLLKDDGVIFISIDDNEQANLKLLCNQIFGEENFINHICHKSRASVSNDKIISSSHNHILLYAKSYDIIFENRKNIGKDPTLDGFNFDDNNDRGKYKLSPVDGPGGAKKGNPYYEFKGITKYWRFSKEKMQQKFDDGLLVINENSIQQKYYLSHAENLRKTDTTWWEDGGLTSNATKKLIELMGGNFFDNPKPIDLLLRMLKLFTNEDKNSIILDFFAGSGTTGHAVMQMNAEDGGNRKFILVQLDETISENSEAKKQGFHNISDITAERLRRASKKIQNETILKQAKEKNNQETKAKTPTLNFKENSSNNNEENNKNTSTKPLDLGFKYFKIDKPYFPVWNYNAKTEAELKNEFSKHQHNNLAQANRDDIAIIYEILNKHKCQLNCSIAPFTTKSSQKTNLYNVAYGFDSFAIVIMKEISEDMLKEIIALKPINIIICEKVFKDNNNLKINIQTLISNSIKPESTTVYYV